MPRRNRIDWEQRRQAVLDDVTESIKRIGWHAIGVGEGKNFPSFTYSQGFRALNHPDIIITGLPVQYAHGFIAMIYDNVREAGVTYQPGADYVGLANGDYPARFLAVHSEWRRELCTLTGLIYGTLEFSVLQLIYPDAQYRWPGEPGYTLSDFCPQLDQPPPMRIVAPLDKPFTPPMA